MPKPAQLINAIFSLALSLPTASTLTQSLGMGVEVESGLTLSTVDHLTMKVNQPFFPG